MKSKQIISKNKKNDNDNQHSGQKKKGRGSTVEKLVKYPWKEYCDGWKYKPRYDFYEAKIQEVVMKKCMY